MMTSPYIWDERAFSSEKMRPIKGSHFDENKFETFGL